MSRPTSAPGALFAAVSPRILLLIAVAVLAAALIGAPWWGVLALAVTIWLGALALAGLKYSAGADRPDAIDPFALREPWRFYVRDAKRAERDVAEILDTVSAGPVLDRLRSMHDRLDVGVDEVWAIASRAQTLFDARRSIDVDELRRRLGAAEDDPNTSAEQVTALRSQLDSADRLEERLDTAQQRLKTLDARLGETVVRTRELATSVGDIGGADGLAANVNDLVDELEALRLGLEEAG